MSDLIMARPWYLRAPVVISALLTLGLISALATVSEIRTLRAALQSLTEGHAEQVRSVVSEGQSHALAAYDAWETQAGQRLVALAALADHLVRDGGRPQALLDSIAIANKLACLTVRSSDRRVLAASTAYAGAVGMAACWDDLEVAGVLDLQPGEAKVLRAPEEDAGGYRLIGAIRRPDGGIVCAGMDARALAEQRRRIGPGRLLRALGERGGSVYLALQDTVGIVAASSNVSRLSSVKGDALLESVLASGRPASREVRFQGRRVLETVSRLDIAGRPVSLLRSAVDLSGIRERERDLTRGVALHSLLLLATIAAGAALVVASRRLALAQTAWARARLEITVLEEERARRERSVALGELASGVAHEIRNPLNAIHVIAQRFGREFRPVEGEEEFRELSGMVRQEVSRINRIIEQFLRYARPPRPNIQPTDLADLARGVVAVVGGRFRLADVALAVQAPERAPCPVDSDLLRQALHNLLDNALAACRPGARVTITLTVAADAVELAVADTGTGIPPEELGRIFNLYHTTKPGGTGLGLAIVDQIASLHSGRVRVDSELGRGSTFTLELPCSGVTT